MREQNRTESEFWLVNGVRFESGSAAIVAAIRIADANESPVEVTHVKTTTTAGMVVQPRPSVVCG